MTLNENTINNEIPKPNMNDDEITINQFNHFINTTLSKYQTNIDTYDTNPEVTNNINEYISNLQSQISSLTFNINNITTYNNELLSQISSLNTQLQLKDQSIIEMNNKLNYIKELYTKNELELKYQFDLYKNVVDDFINSQQDTLQLFSISNNEIEPSKTLLYAKKQLNVIAKFIDTIVFDNKTLIELNEQHQSKLTQYESKLHSLEEQLAQYGNNNYQTINNENIYLKELVNEKEKQIQNLLATQSEMEQNSINEINLLKQKIKEVNNKKELPHSKFQIVSECEIWFNVEEDKDNDDNDDITKVDEQQEIKNSQQNDIEQQLQWNDILQMNNCIQHQYIGMIRKHNHIDINMYNYNKDINDDIHKYVEINKQPINNLRTKIEMLEKIFKDQETTPLIKED